MAFRTAFRSVYAVAAVSLLTTGCYVDSAGGRLPGASGRGIIAPKVDTSAADVGSCSFAIGRGCFDGHVTARTQFFVDGKPFFNADDLATRFRELLTVENSGTALAADSNGYRLVLATPLGNESFLSGFEYDLTGGAARSGKVRSDGSFGIDDLPEGTYDLRVQKAVRFTLAANTAHPTTPSDQAVDATTATQEAWMIAEAAEPAQPAEPNGASTVPSKPQPPMPAAAPTQAPKAPASQPDTSAAQPTSPTPRPDTVSAETIEKSFCATIYADAVVNIRRGERLWDKFENFRLHVTNSSCGSGSAASPAVLTVAP